MEIMKVKNYKTFAETLKAKTECDVTIKLISSNHTHTINLLRTGFRLEFFVQTKEKFLLRLLSITTQHRTINTLTCSTCL